MHFNLKYPGLMVFLSAGAASAALAVTALSFSTAVNVSQSPTATEKAKDVRVAYQDGDTFRKAWVYTYGEGDGVNGRTNVYVKYSFDEGLTWSAPVLLSRDAAGQPTGGQTITTQGAYVTSADNNKPNIFAPPTTTGPRIVVTWTSAYCPQDPSASHAGAYTSAVQGQSALVNGGAVDHAFYCLWTATTTDPLLATWETTQLTNGSRDAIGDVVTGNATGTAYALTWQEDPAGLKPGEAEGPGDGGSGATVTPGTNIWYSSAATPSGAAWRTNLKQVSDNNSAALGAAGASRPNLSVSGSTAVLAYEETACTGGSKGKCVMYHSFPTLAPPFNTTPGAAGDAGTVVSDVTKNARRVRLVLQGAAAAPTSNVRALLLWRESAPSAEAGAPADIVVRRGLANASASGSSGLSASDILLDTPRYLTNVAATGGNANAQRALIRNNFMALAYDMTPSMQGANPERTQPVTASYNLYLTRSLDGGATWESARNVSQLTDLSMRVVEPRIMATPGTLINPLTGVADEGDTQNSNVFYLAYATEQNSLLPKTGRVYVTRTTDQGATFEPFVPVSPQAAGQSEVQLRAKSDGTSVGALWMQEQTVGNAQTNDVMFASAVPVALLAPDVVAPATPVNAAADGGGGCSSASGTALFDPLLLLLAALGAVGLRLRRVQKGRSQGV